MAQPQFTNKVAVRPLPEQSDPERGQHAFAYTVTIRNTGDVTAQLIARHWVITDAEGRTEEVRGLAVVGHQPVLKPDVTMRGTFFCMTEDARPFDAPIPEFGLTTASALH
jgi:ApaG protein